MVFGSDNAFIIFKGDICPVSPIRFRMQDTIFFASGQT